MGEAGGAGGLEGEGGGVDQWEAGIWSCDLRGKSTESIENTEREENTESKENRERRKN